MNVVLVGLYSFRELIERELLPAAEQFKAVGPGSEQSPEPGAGAT